MPRSIRRERARLRRSRGEWAAGRHMIVGAARIRYSCESLAPHGARGTHAFHSRRLLYISNASATSTEPPDSSIGQPFALAAASS
jgi:hypothetical protein